MKKKIIIIGGGPSAIMSAIAASTDCDVTILEKKAKLGTKLLISGGGRCNLTNNATNQEIVENVVGNGRFLHSALSIFNTHDIIKFFETNGCMLKEEDHGRMFPRSNRSIDILKVLMQQLKQRRVKICYNVQICDVIKENNQIIAVVDTNKQKYYGDHFVFATGGKSYPQVGTTGDAYPLMIKLGHSVTKLYPCEVPLISNDKFIQDGSLMGVSFNDVELSIFKQNKKKVVTIKHDLLFTHFGLSGPSALRCSYFVQKLLLKQPEVNIKIDFFPDLSKDHLYAKIQKLTSENSDKTLINVLSFIINKKIVKQIFVNLDILEELKAKNANKYINEIVIALKSFNVTILKTQGFDKAFVTGGGVNIKEIDPKTLRSKIISNLSICGELLDLNAYTGGYNITTAFCTGYVSGISI